MKIALTVLLTMVVAGTLICFVYFGVLGSYQQGYEAGKAEVLADLPQTVEIRIWSGTYVGASADAEIPCRIELQAGQIVDVGRGGFHVADPKLGAVVEDCVFMGTRPPQEPPQ